MHEHVENPGNLVGGNADAAVTHPENRLLTFSNDDIRGKLEQERGADAGDVNFLPFQDVEESVRASVKRARSSPLLPEGLPVSGWVYDVRSGRIDKVE